MYDYDAYLEEVKKRQKRRRIFFVCAALLVVGAAALRGSFWLMVESQIFEIGSVEIVGARSIPREAVMSVLRAAIPARSMQGRLLGFNNILAWPDELAGAALAANPLLKRIEIQKELQSKDVKVFVVEREPYGVWCGGAGTECAWFDEEGVAFKRSPRTEGAETVVVNDYSKERVGLGETVLNKEFLGNLRAIFEALRGAVSVKEIALRRAEFQEIEVRTQEGPVLYFGLRAPYKNLREVVQAVAARKDFPSLQYADFRVEDKVFYK